MRWFIGALCVGLVASGSAVRSAEFDQTRPVDGLRQNLPQVDALVGARIVLAPGRVVEKGNLIVRDGLIQAVGPEVEVPADAQRWDMSGKTLYPGLIDAYGEAALEDSETEQGTGYWNSHVQPQRSVADLFSTKADQNGAFRSQGITLRLVAPRDGIIKGQSAILATGDTDRSRALLRAPAALHIRLAAPRQRARDQYPNSPMGAVALARQAIYDALWYRDAWRVFHSQPGTPRPEQNAALAALEPFVDQQQLVVIDTPDDQYLLRADRFAREFGLRVAFVGSGQEYRRLAEVASTGRPLIVPLDFPSPPDVGTPEAAATISLERLMHWDHAPENPARLQASGVPIALTSHGLESPRGFLSAVRTAVRRGLAPDDALRALTTFPARLLAVDRFVGTLEPGKLAHFFVTDGDLFEKQTRVVETWVDGTRYVVEPSPELDLRGTWQLTVQGRDQTLELVVSGKPRKLKAVWRRPGPDDPASEDAPRDEPLKKFETRELLISGQFDAQAWDLNEGVALLSATLVGTQPDNRKMIGRVTLPDGSVRAFEGRMSPPSSQDKEEPPARDEPQTDEASQTQADPPAVSSPPTNGDEPRDVAPEDDVEQSSPVTAPGEAEEETEEETEEDGDDDQPTTDLSASFPVNYPLGAFGISQPPAQAEWTLFREATVWTCGPDGVLAQADVLIHRGLIERIAERIDEVPEGTCTVECRGWHLTPGIIDCHSHMATDGGVNEGTQAITAEVRVGDFIDARDITIYRQLAGGVTAANILHGSANPIGGQNQVIKLRWGATGEGMKFQEAPAGIKFALGENVKQSNWGDNFTRRYPQSRMGVEQIIRDAFLTARQYRHRQRVWQSERQGLPPRHDLELEALAEIQEGTRLIHCHSYRQDEILALLRTLEAFGIQIGTLQHILEGYKVAEVMQQHGAMASAFSDWWAYKIEVFDAIPYNGALMHKAGVVVSFNSDDHELARHLNHEAAKAVKYGGVAPAEALKFVTLNPAPQLRIDSYVGSIEVGKHADLVLWNASPLSVTSRCEQTWIDGRKYFDREADLAERSRWQEIRATLVQKILGSGQAMQKEEEREPDERDLWPRVDIYCRLQARGIK